jgi:hypothetical protein
MQWSFWYRAALEPAEICRLHTSGPIKLGDAEFLVFGPTLWAGVHSRDDNDFDEATAHAGDRRRPRHGAAWAFSEALVLEAPMGLRVPTRPRWDGERTPPDLSRADRPAGRNRSAPGRTRTSDRLRKPLSSAWTDLPGAWPGHRLGLAIWNSAPLAVPARPRLGPHLRCCGLRWRRGAVSLREPHVDCTFCAGTTIARSAVETWRYALSRSWRWRRIHARTPAQRAQFECGSRNVFRGLSSFARPAEYFQAECYLLFRFSATASRMRFFSAPSSIFSFSLMSMARLTFPSRLELNNPEGSFKAAPLKNVSLTTFL